MTHQLLPGLAIPPYVSRLRNVHSQYGEDGLLEYVLEHLPDCPRYFVEFGAWDGLHLSNCAHLAEQGWGGCFIEGEPDRAKDAERNYAHVPAVVVMTAFVMPNGESSLDKLLARTPCPREFGVLSIDIDGNDFHIWEHLRVYQPAVCIVEFNPTIPVQVDFVQALDPQLHQGCSLAALHRLAGEKGYILAGATELNAVFVREDLAAAARLPAYAPVQVKTTTFETHVFHGYDGTVHVAGYGQLVWHGVRIRPEAWQLLPPELRRFPVGQDEAYFAALSKLKDQG
jgi:hypothetical protein